MVDDYERVVGTGDRGRVGGMEQEQPDVALLQC